MIKTRREVTENEYKAVKALLKEGMSVPAIAKAVRRSDVTIYFIRKSTDFDDYHRLSVPKNKKTALEEVQKKWQEQVYNSLKDEYVTMKIPAWMAGIISKLVQELNETSISQIPKI